MSSVQDFSQQRITQKTADTSIRNFSIVSPSMGLLVIQPVTIDPVDLESSSLVVFPHRVDAATFNVGVEWAAGTQTPIFCIPADIERFEKEGFGAYRFHKLDGYREVDYQGGAVEFFPAKKRRLKGIKGWTQEVGDWLGISTSPGYHVLIKPKGEHPILYLASTFIDPSEWTALIQSNPSLIVGSPLFTSSEWHAFSTLVKRRVTPAADLSKVPTVSKGNGPEGPTKRENPLWAVRTGSL